MLSHSYVIKNWSSEDSTSHQFRKNQRNNSPSTSLSCSNDVRWFADLCRMSFRVVQSGSKSLVKIIHTILAMKLVGDGTPIPDKAIAHHLEINP